MTQLCLTPQVFWSTFTLILLAGSSFAVAEESAGLSSFLQQHCLRCHGEQKQEGKLALHQLNENMVSDVRIKLWFKVLDKIQSGEMPPNDEKQPSAEERRQVIQLLKQQ